MTPERNSNTENGSLMSSASLDAKVKQARERLDAHVRDIVAWHFHPETGAPFWVEKAKTFNFNPLAICRRIVAEKSGPLWIGEDWGLFSFQPASFRPPALLVDQNLRASKLDFILAGQRGGTWRLIECLG